MRNLTLAATAVGAGLGSADSVRRGGTPSAWS